MNNPMASPYTLGLAAAAGLGASVVIAFGGFGLPETVAVPIGAFVMTMLASGILFLFASARRFNSAMLVLVGIALLFLFQSILSLIQFIAAPEISQQILFLARRRFAGRGRNTSYTVTGNNICNT